MRSKKHELTKLKDIKEKSQERKESFDKQVVFGHFHPDKGIRISRSTYEAESVSYWTYNANRGEIE